LFSKNGKEEGDEKPENFVVALDFTHIREELFEKRVFCALGHRLAHFVPVFCIAVVCCACVCSL
jgi:hypothetical protein